MAFAPATAAAIPVSRLCRHGAAGARAGQQAVQERNLLVDMLVCGVRYLSVSKRE
jgi:hypothetical protein